MFDFIDRTSTESGTPINRKAMMALQGFEAKTTLFNDNGSIVEINADGHTLTTTFNPDGSVTEVFVGKKTITRTTRFVGNTVIEEVLS